MAYALQVADARLDLAGANGAAKALQNIFFFDDSFHLISSSRLPALACADDDVFIHGNGDAGDVLTEFFRVAFECHGQKGGGGIHRRVLDAIEQAHFLFDGCGALGAAKPFQYELFFHC
jgi:hypothetical protein